MSNYIKYEETETTLYRYYDRDGVEVKEGDYLKNINSGRVDEVFLTTDKELGTDATNPSWILDGRALPGEKGIYPLNGNDLMDAIHVTKQDYIKYMISQYKKRVDKLRDREFMLQMCDHWSSDDYETDRRLTESIRYAENEIKELEKEMA